ncbi:MAG: hypothetical protein WCS21_08465 [Lachnospiraceae bacterium]
MEDKKKFLKALEGLLKMTRDQADLDHIEYEASINKVSSHIARAEEAAVLVYDGGFTRKVNITGDSEVAIIRDIANALR